MQDSKFVTAVEKERVLKAWEGFLKSGMAQDKFTKGLYNHLIQHCAFIAHYDIWGFCSTYFTSGDGRKQFLSQFDQRNARPDGVIPSVEYGNLVDWRRGDYEDLNNAMVEVAAVYIPVLLSLAEAVQRASDIAVATKLLSRHGIKL